MRVLDALARIGVVMQRPNRDDDARDYSTRGKTGFHRWLPRNHLTAHSERSAGARYNRVNPSAAVFWIYEHTVMIRDQGPCRQGNEQQSTAPVGLEIDRSHLVDYSRSHGRGVLVRDRGPMPSWVTQENLSATMSSLTEPATTLRSQCPAIGVLSTVSGTSLGMRRLWWRVGISEVVAEDIYEVGSVEGWPRCKGELASGLLSTTCAPIWCVVSGSGRCRVGSGCRPRPRIVRRPRGLSVLSLRPTAAGMRGAASTVSPSRRGTRSCGAGDEDGCADRCRDQPE